VSPAVLIGTSAGAINAAYVAGHGGGRDALERSPTSALGTAMQALTLLIEQRLVMEVSQFIGGATLKVLPPLCPLAVSSVDFSRAAELISRARVCTGSWLDSGGPSLPAPARFPSLHDHRAAARDASHRIASS
jgi:NTE family protein